MATRIIFGEVRGVAKKRSGSPEHWLHIFRNQKLTSGFVGNREFAK